MKTVEEAAAALGVTRRRIYALIDAGKLGAEKVSGVWLIDEASLRRRIEGGVSRQGGRPKKGAGDRSVGLVLMNREHAVAEATYDVVRNSFDSVGPVLDRERAPVGLVDGRGRLSAASLSLWWSDRGIPRSRKGLARLLEQRGVSVPEELAYRNLGLSLSDQYWVRPIGTDLAWEEVNFFENGFEEIDIDGSAVSGGRPRHPDNTSDGVLPKHWRIAADGKRVLVKAGGPFAQEPCNEVIATELCRRVMPASEYVSYTLGEWQGAPACACPDFLSAEEEFVPAHYVRMVLEQAAHHNDHQHYLECCNVLGVTDAPARISYGIVCDDLMANTDRHWRNFGIVRNVETLACRIAPIFDTGSSLWHDREDLLRARDYTFESKQFERNPGRQLQLAELEWLDAGAIQDLDEYARETLEGSLLPQWRIDRICEGIRWRVRRMMNIREYL